MSSRRRAAAVAAVALLVAACGGDDREEGGAATSGTEAPAADETTTTGVDAAPAAPCGATLEDVQALLPPTSGVTENSTPDPFRCSFTWTDGAPFGIDVATVEGGASAVADRLAGDAGYRSLEGEDLAAFAGADAAYLAQDDRAVSLALLVGPDVVAVDLVTDGSLGDAAVDAEDVVRRLAASALARLGS